MKPSGGFAVLLKQKVPKVFVSLEKKGSVLFLKHQGPSVAK
jgi:hypothetical protein